MKLYRYCLFFIAPLLSQVALTQDFYLHENGVTIVCDDAQIGDTWEYFGVTYTKREKSQITFENASYQIEVIKWIL